MEALADKNLDKAKEINAREKIIDYLSSEITDYLVEVNRYELPLADSRRIGALFHVVIDLERIGDHAINILENAEKRSKLNEKFKMCIRDSDTDDLARRTNPLLRR